MEKCRLAIHSPRVSDWIVCNPYKRHVAWMTVLEILLELIYGNESSRTDEGRLIGRAHPYPSIFEEQGERAGKSEERRRPVAEPSPKQNIDGGN